MKSKLEVVRDMIGKEYFTRHVGIEEETTEVESIYRDIVEVTNELFAKIPWKIVFTVEDTYSSCKEMIERVEKEGILYIYSGGCEHPYYLPEENMKGRAVHDYFHILGAHPFSFLGEYNAYQAQKLFYPKHTWSVLFAEIPAQTAAYYVNGKNHNFQQRAIKAPLDWIQLMEMVTE